MLTGVVEADETYVGGKPRANDPPAKRGRGTKKTPVVALVQRNGQVRAKVVNKLTAEKLRAEIVENVSPEATLMTDEFPSYTSIGKHFKRHGVIKHKSGVYSQGDVTTNTAESFFALLKRGHYGVYHQMSKQHLHRYVNEFAFRWNHRKVSDSERRDAAIGKAEGKRLTYR